jgi:hypothetical protein
LVEISVVVQLVSAVLYVPALLGLLARTRLGRIRGVRWGAALLLIGAMGSAADAVLHLLAYAMTAPNLDRATLVTVMTFMQGRQWSSQSPAGCWFRLVSSTLVWSA